MKISRFMSKKFVSKAFIKTMLYNILLFNIIPLCQATLDISTVKELQGHRPTFTTDMETHIDNLDLFGLAVNGNNHYGDDIKNMFLLTAYPFKDKFAIAPLKQPNSSEYVDLDGDEFKDLVATSPISMTWYYTDSTNKLVEFTPTATDTFCSLTKAGKAGPFKVKVSANLLLSSKYGNPINTPYPNDIVTTQPSRTYTILEDTGFCYAKPELNPTQATGVSATQWDARNGFLIQSHTNPAINFPTTAFYGAKFDLLLAKDGVANQYNWTLVRGNELASLTSNANVVTITFNTAAALSSQTAWNYVIGSGTGYSVLVQGIHKTTGYKIEYPFTITKWFTSWDKNQAGKNLANTTSAPNVVAGCLDTPGIYRISNSDEVSNAPFGNSAGSANFTREIGTLLGEWGDPTQTTYPGSWAAASSQGNAYRRIWLYDTGRNQYCDLHTYNAKYHCVSEADSKNGICTSVSSR
ncbi:hypothetical protein PT273_05630 [Orbaceae bacterium ESL0727]|nr:hypothetical protein [Orbaceae bacterium ESL0727]